MRYSPRPVVHVLEEVAVNGLEVLGVEGVGDELGVLGELVASSGDDAVLVERKRRGILDARLIPHDVLVGLGVEVRRPVLLMTHGLFALLCALLVDVLACQHLVSERLR